MEGYTSLISEAGRGTNRRRSCQYVTSSPGPSPLPLAVACIPGVPGILFFKYNTDSDALPFPHSSAGHLSCFNTTIQIYRSNSRSIQIQSSAIAHILYIGHLLELYHVALDEVDHLQGAGGRGGWVGVRVRAWLVNLLSTG